MEYTENAESKFEHGLKKLQKAWKSKENELQLEKQAKLSLLTQELSKLRTDYTDCKKRLGCLEDRNLELKDRIKELKAENKQLEEFKYKLVESIKEQEASQKRESFKNVEEQGREFFFQAKARLSFECFSVFSLYLKQLNEMTISKEMALVELKDVFGENEDLFEAFTNLLKFY